jgi:Asp-tRNA(Asn)/Glu-tRNA(Gln) amidotransferase A subunit family amidase
VPLGRRGSTRPSLPADYTQFANPDGLRGARIGVTRQGVDAVSTIAGAVFDAAIAAMQGAGATIVDLDAAGFVFPPGDGEFLVLLFDFVGDLRSYFATRVGVPMAGATLADLIAFDDANAATEMPYFAQELFDLAAALEPGADTPQLGISFIGPAFSEPALIRVAAGFERATRARIVPKLFQTLPLDNVEGLPLARPRRGGLGKPGERRRWTPHWM